MKINHNKWFLAIDGSGDKFPIKCFAFGVPTFGKTIAGRDISVGCYSLAYLVHEYKGKEIEIYVREVDQ